MALYGKNVSLLFVTISLAKCKGFSCVAVSHLGHHPRDTEVERMTDLHNLDQQVAHKQAVVKTWLERHPQTNVILGGHSVGAYICLEVLRVVPQSRVVKVMGLFPTVHHIGARLLTLVMWYYEIYTNLCRFHTKRPKIVPSDGALTMDDGPASDCDSLPP